MARSIMAKCGAGVLGAWFAPRSSGAPRTKHQTRQQGQKTKSGDGDDNDDDNKTNTNKHTTQNTTQDGGSKTSLLRSPHTLTTPPPWRSGTNGSREINLEHGACFLTARSQQDRFSGQLGKGRSPIGVLWPTLSREHLHERVHASWQVGVSLLMRNHRDNILSHLDSLLTCVRLLYVLVVTVRSWEWAKLHKMQQK